MSEVELRELRYFVAVARERNFSRAAERLGMAQSPLSRAIAQLESRLGVRLLERSTRQVELTDAGVMLLQQAQLVLEAAAAAVARTRRAGQADPALVVAVKPGSDGGLLRDIVTSYQRPELPRAEVTVTSWGGPADLLRSGDADVALLRSPFPEAGLDIWELLSEPRVVALPAGHRLAGRTRLRRADLAAEPVPHWPDADDATAAYWSGQDPRSRTAQWPAGAGELPPPAPAGPAVSDLAQLLEVIALGQAVAFLPASTAARHPRADVVYLPVTDLSPSVVAVAWPEGSRSPAVAAFVQAAIEAAGRNPGNFTAAIS
jgi:DNA-binding transcriptional LysR family regulator